MWLRALVQVRAPTQVRAPRSVCARSYPIILRRLHRSIVEAAERAASLSSLRICASTLCPSGPLLAVLVAPEARPPLLRLPRTLLPPSRRPSLPPCLPRALRAPARRHCRVASRTASVPPSDCRMQPATRSERACGRSSSRPNSCNHHARRQQQQLQLHPQLPPAPPATREAAPSHKSNARELP
jgi:hypothetical protein